MLDDLNDSGSQETWCWAKDVSFTDSDMPGLAVPSCVDPAFLISAMDIVLRA